MIRRTLFLVIGSVALGGMCGCQSAYTSINHEADGKYVLTGATAGFFSVNGFVDVGTYDPKSKTLTVKETLLR